ncbi:hypothetical protein HYALB_00003440 [Hymenoscyphus albidus]|uniref:Uncharacterized protein n=1 Tax=Hymenoscyphus albidus TaxID=595503 RepID=A0A9N9L8Y7_9HELO|nr:hypothetical protein HYALB_00003440 [Hymenoscyphus albidus]
MGAKRSGGGDAKRQRDDEERIESEKLFFFSAFCNSMVRRGKMLMIRAGYSESASLSESGKLKSTGKVPTAERLHCACCLLTRIDLKLRMESGDAIALAIVLGFVLNQRQEPEAGAEHAGLASMA